MQFSHFIIYPSLFSIETQLEEVRGQGGRPWKKQQKKVAGEGQNTVLRHQIGELVWVGGQGLEP